MWFYVKQGRSTAFSNGKYKTQNKINPYKSEFKQGATIVPRSFYFVDLDQETPLDFEGRILNIKTAEDVKADSKKPWNNMDFHGRIESRFLFRTALSKSILPFVLHQPNLVVLPLIITYDELRNEKISLLTPNELIREGCLHASRWFQNVEYIWDIHKTEKNKNISAKDYANWQNKITDQNLNAPYFVLYNASAKDANATIVRRVDWDLSFIVESKAYVFFTRNVNEAYYLTAILNSSIPNGLMKDFQSRGLFGARDVHKKILDIYYPKYDEENSIHQQLVLISELAHIKAKEFVDNHSTINISGLALGKMRLNIKRHLAQEMIQIDKIVKKLIG